MSSSALLISIALHAVLILIIGGMVALKFYVKSGAGFVVEDQKPKLERRKLQLPVQTEPFMEQMSKPKRQSTSRLTANAPQMVNIPEQGEYVKMAPPPSFKGAYTNFLQLDRTLEFNSKYRDVDFGLSTMQFFGVRGKAEKIVIVLDASKSMLYDRQGGMDSYQMVQEDLHEIIDGMRSATLFNVVLFDEDKVSVFNPALLPATPLAKTNALAWVGGINTNLIQVGITDDMVNYSSPKNYDIPMAKEDVTGWLKGIQAAFEMKPEIIFMLGSDWGSTTTLEHNISYFKKSKAYTTYQKKRAQYFLNDEERAEEMEEYTTDFNEFREIALKMLELENQARNEMSMQPKVVQDWDEILADNKIELPPPPLMEEEMYATLNPAHTRYTFNEILETVFTMGMEQYRELGFPQLNFVLLRGTSSGRNSAAASSVMTSDAKFRLLSRMLRGRFRYLKGMPQIINQLDQDESDIRRLLEDNTENEI